MKLHHTINNEYYVGNPKFDFFKTTKNENEATEMTLEVAKQLINTFGFNAGGTFYRDENWEIVE